MKLLFCDNTLWGLINFRGDVIEHFHNVGYEIVLVAPEKENEEMTTSLPHYVKFYPVKMNRGTMSLLPNIVYFFQLLNIYRKEKPAHIFHYTIQPNIFGSIAASICGITSTAMVPGLGTIFKHDKLSYRFARRLYKIGLSFSERVIVLNKANYDTIIRREMCGKEKLVLFPGGEAVNMDRFTYVDNSADEVTFLFIGRLLLDKGYREFVQAAKIVKVDYPAAKFELLGFMDVNNPSGIQKDELERDVASGVVKYLGYTHDISSVYRRKGIVIVLPSYHEGLNRTLMEACATGKPIITTDIPGCREAVANGKNGILVKPRNAVSLADAMKCYIQLSPDQKEEYSHASRSHAEEYFNMSNVIAQYDSFLSKSI